MLLTMSDYVMAPNYAHVTALQSDVYSYFQYSIFKYRHLLFLDCPKILSDLLNIGMITNAWRNIKHVQIFF